MQVKNKNGYMHQGNGMPWLTDKNQKVPALCKKCNAHMRVKFRGEPVFICDNDHFFGTVKFPSR